MIRTRSIAMAVLAILLLTAVLPMMGASADTIYLKVIRYDGMDNILYAPCYACYGIEVEGADEDDEITYRWQVNVAGIVGSHEWLEASDCTWTWNYFSPVITTLIKEGYHTVTPPNRFCLRCIVKVEGQEYVSPVFELVARERHTFDNIEVVDVTAPKVGAHPTASGSFATEHLSLGKVTWYKVGADGTYTQMSAAESFASGKSYAVEICGKMEDSWFLDHGSTTATVGGAPARVQLEPGDDRSIRVYEVYYLDGTQSVPLGYSLDLSNMLHFLRSGIVPAPDVTDGQEVNVDLMEGDSYTFSFPYIPLESWAVNEGYSIFPAWNLKENGTVITAGSGSSATYDGWTVGKEYLLTAVLGLARDGALIPNVVEEFRFLIKVSDTDQPPVITYQSPQLVDYTDGQDVALYCLASGKSLTYTWYRYGLKKSRFNDSYYAWMPIYSPDKVRVTLYEAGEKDNGTMYKCVVKNAAGTVESKVFTLNRIHCQLSQLLLSTDQLVEGGKVRAFSIYGADTGIQAVTGELFVSENAASTAAATDYMSFAATVTKKFAGDAVPEGKDCYLGISVLTEDGYSFASDLSVLVNMHEVRFLSLDETSAYFVLRIDPSWALPKGDVNGDGEVDVMDYMLIKRHVLQTKLLDEPYKARADVTGDGEIDIKDYTIVKRIVLGTYQG